MTEIRVGLLFNIASNLSSSNETLKLLRSYYLMRCNDLTKGYGLPSKHFSTKVRCPHCCLEWTKGTEVKVRHIKRSKRQQQRIKSSKKTGHKEEIHKKRALLHCNEMEQVCTFCKQSTTTQLIKPEREYLKLTTPKEYTILKVNKQKKQVINNGQKKAETKKFGETKTYLKKNTVANVYSNAFDVFSLKNEKNIISSAVQNPMKVIKNNKKKKDKFAGLCQKAVLASAKLKQQQSEPENTRKSKLSLFLKPSSG